MIVETTSHETIMSLLALASGGTAISVPKLEKTPSGEYTAGSVATDLVEALRMNLERQADGNYAPPSWPLARSSSAVRSALFGLQLGG